MALNKEKKTIDLKNQPRVLARDTFKFKNTYDNELWKVDYVYEVELLLLKDLRGAKSVINTKEFKDFMNQELQQQKDIKYDNDINIRDLYPIDIHLKGASENNIKIFNEINNTILEYSDRITRRVTKKEIVYKKDKTRGILSIKIHKVCKVGLIIYFLKDIELYDISEKLNKKDIITHKPFVKRFIINDNNDFIYFNKIIKLYLDKVLS